MMGIFDPISDFSKRNVPIDYQSQRSLTLSFVHREKKNPVFVLLPSFFFTTRKMSSNSLTVLPQGVFAYLSNLYWL